jgi:ABC-type multidrug transport system ATPase subunit
MRIELSDIGKQYGNHWIFKKVNARFESGNIYAITGHNGSGKSTLLQIISGFVTPTDGSILYQKNGDRIEIASWFKHLSITAPYLELFEEFTVTEAIELHHQLQALSSSPEEIINDIELDAH